MIIENDVHHWKGSPIHRTSLHNEIANKLRLMIQEGELEPGARVPEIKLCQIFGISRTPLREALKVLASEGLIELRPNRGSMVAPVLIGETESVFEVLEVTERFIGRLACERMTKSEIEDLRSRHDRMMSLHRLGDRVAYYNHDQAFRMTLAEFTRNGVLTGIYATLITKATRAALLSKAHLGRWSEVGREHEIIIALIERRDGVALGDALAAHVAMTKACVVAGLHPTEYEEEP